MNMIITVAEAAKIYGCSASNIRRLIADGKLDPIRKNPYLLHAEDVKKLSKANAPKRLAVLRGRGEYV